FGRVWYTLDATAAGGDLLGYAARTALGAEALPGGEGGAFAGIASAGAVVWFLESSPARLFRRTALGAIQAFALPDGAAPVGLAVAGGGVWMTEPGRNRIAFQSASSGPPGTADLAAFVGDDEVFPVTLDGTPVRTVGGSNGGPADASGPVLQ